MIGWGGAGGSNTAGDPVCGPSGVAGGAGGTIGVVDGVGGSTFVPTIIPCGGSGIGGVASGPGAETLAGGTAEAGPEAVGWLRGYNEPPDDDRPGTVIAWPAAPGWAGVVTGDTTGGVAVVNLSFVRTGLVSRRSPAAGRAAVGEPAGLLVPAGLAGVGVLVAGCCPVWGPTCGRTGRDVGGCFSVD